jgi:hypothetical protein
MNAMMLVARRVLVVPKPLVIIGVSPKSFGWYWVNDREGAGVEFLKNMPDNDVLVRVQNRILPGPNLNTSWLLSMETLLLRYGEEHRLSVNYGRYRMLQALHALRRTVSESRSFADLNGIVSKLTWKERLAFGLLLQPYARIAVLLPRSLRQRAAAFPVDLLKTYPPHTPTPIEGAFENMLEVFERLDPRVLAA